MTAIQNDLEKNGWHFERYGIATKEGREEAKGWVKGPFAVRENCAIIDSKHHEFWYVIDHVATGMRLYSCDEKWEAFNLVQALLDEVPDIQAFKNATPEAIPETVRHAAGRIIDRFRFDGVDRKLLGGE